MSRKLDARKWRGPMPGYRDAYRQTIGADDVAFPNPVAIAAIDTGDLTYVTAEGREVTTAISDAGQVLAGPGGFILLVSEIKGASTVTEVLVGVL